MKAGGEDMQYIILCTILFLIGFTVSGGLPYLIGELVDFITTPRGWRPEFAEKIPDGEAP